jgi:lipoate-protein ligase A
MAVVVSSIHRFESTDPWSNLAREELWLDELPPETGRLLLYVNSPCVVLGKHQNPLREVRLEEAARRGVPLVRRSSGGGTVYHDEGNLNWSFLLPKAGYDRNVVTAVVAQALSPLGLELTWGEKGDLLPRGFEPTGEHQLGKPERKRPRPQGPYNAG